MQTIAAQKHWGVLEEVFQVSHWIQTDPWREFNPVGYGVTSGSCYYCWCTVILVGNLYNRIMCDLVIALDYKIDLATRVCSNIWRFGAFFFNLIMLKGIVLPRGERACSCGWEKERETERLWCGWERESLWVWTECMNYSADWILY